MCGIVGYYSISENKNIIAKSAKKMVQMLLHRGPDQQNVISTENFSGGVTRLAIESLKYGTQPLEDDRFIIGFNGEIFNYRELTENYFPNLGIDSEIRLLLELWKIKKKDFIHLLNGQFAIFIYDKKSNDIFLFRDPFGIRPIFFYKDKHKFVFGSEIKSIISVLNKKFEINENSIMQTSMFWTNLGNQTSVKDIYSLQPGYSLQKKKNELIIKSYYKNPYFKIKYDKRIETKKNLEDELFNQITKSVKNQIHGEVGHACYLSGGIDSSVIAHLLSKEISNLETFSVEFDNEDYDESTSQKIISKFLNSKHHSIKIKNGDIAKIFPSVINSTESILFRTAPAPMYLLSKLVNKLGHKVVFTGEGADEILYGYDIFFENRIRNFWRRNPNSKLRPKLLQKLYYYLPQFKNSRYFEILKDFYKITLNENNYSFFYSHLVRWSQFNHVSKFFNFSNSDDLQEKMFISVKENMPLEFFDLDEDARTQYLEMNTLLSGYLLSSQGDRMTMANSVEGRYPFLDMNFVNFCSNINPKTLAPGIKSKNLFRNTFKNILPKEIITKPKVAYQAPEAKSFLDHKFISKEAEEFIENISKTNQLNKKNFEGLINKIKNPISTSRLGFRENMAFIMGISCFYLKKNITNWQSGINFK